MDTGIAVSQSEQAGAVTVVDNSASSAVTDVLDSVSTNPQVVHVSLGNQTVQVQSVIQAPPSVIHTASGQAIQAIQVAAVVSDGDGTSADEDAESNRKRRELLARRPSYRKILNELSGTEQQQVITVQAKVEGTDESNSSQTSGAEDGDGTGVLSASTASAVQFAGATGVTVVPAGAIQLASHPDTATGLQTLTMTNDSVKAGGTTHAQAGTTAATIVQYAQGPDGQFFIPGNVQYQIAPTTTLPQGVVMATGGASIGSPQHVPEEASRKRELRLLKNREAARECRRKKKEYVKCLENRVAVLENQNKTLIEELKSLKELYCQKEAQS